MTDSLHMRHFPELDPKAPPETKRREIERHVARYLEAGGEVQHCDQGVSTLKHQPVHRNKEQMLEAKKKAYWYRQKLLQKG